MAERIRGAIEALRIPTAGNSPYGHLTTSVGVTIIGPDDLAADDGSWLGRADAALYLAKANGRNRCELGDTLAVQRQRPGSRAIDESVRAPAQTPTALPDPAISA